jgi:hypothetical protein
LGGAGGTGNDGSGPSTFSSGGDGGNIGQLGVIGSGAQGGFGGLNGLGGTIVVGAGGNLAVKRTIGNAVALFVPGSPTDNSLYAGGANGIVIASSLGGRTVTASSPQMSNSGDFESTVRNIPVALTLGANGSQFTVGSATAANGTAGSISGASVFINALPQANVVTSGSFAPFGGITILEQNFPESFENGTNATPAEQVAILQVSSKAPQEVKLTFSGDAIGGNINLFSSNAPSSGFTNLVVPTNVTFNTALPVLTANSSLTVRGTLNIFPIGNATIVTPSLNVFGQIIDLTGALNIQGNPNNSHFLSVLLSNTGVIASSVGNLSFNAVNAGTISITSVGNGLLSAGGGLPQIKFNGGVNGFVAASIDQFNGTIFANGTTLTLTSNHGSMTIGQATATTGSIGIATGLGSNGNITLLSDVVSPTGISILADGLGNIIQTPGKFIQAPVLHLTYAANPLVTPPGVLVKILATKTNDLTITSPGQAYIANIGNLMLEPSTAATISINTLGSIATNGALNAHAVTLACLGPVITSTDTIVLNGDVGDGSGAVLLAVQGTGTITQNSGIVRADRLLLSSRSGSIGVLNTDIRSLLVTTEGGAVNIFNTGAIPGHNGDIDIVQSHVGTPVSTSGLFFLSTNGNINVTQTLQANSLTLAGDGTLGSNTNINIGAPVIGTGPNGTINLHARGTGSITKSGFGTLTAPNVILNAEAGLIGLANLPLPLSGAPIKLNVTTTTGSAFLTATAPVTMVNGSSLGGTFTVTGTYTFANNAFVSAGGSVFINSPAGAITQATAGNVVIYSPMVSLSGAAGVGSPSIPLGIATQYNNNVVNLNVNTFASVYVNGRFPLGGNTASPTGFNIYSNSSGANFNLNVQGNLTFGPAVTITSPVSLILTTTGMGAGSTGSITQAAGPTIASAVTPTLKLNATGDIAITARHLALPAPLALTAVAGGGITVHSLSPVNLFGLSKTGAAASTGFSLVANSNIVFMPGSSIQSLLGSAPSILVQVNGSSGSITQTTTALSLTSPSITVIAGSGALTGTVGFPFQPLAVSSGSSSPITLQGQGGTGVYFAAASNGVLISGQNFVNSTTGQYRVISFENIVLQSGATVRSGGSIDLEAVNNFTSVTQSDASGTTTLFAPTMILKAGSQLSNGGANIGSSTNYLTIAASMDSSLTQSVNLTASASGDVFINASTIASPSVKIDIANAFSGSSGGIILNATGNINILPPALVKATNGSVSLTAGGSITQVIPIAQIISPTVTLTALSPTASIGTALVKIGVNSGIGSGNLSQVVNLNVQAGKDVYVSGANYIATIGKINLVGALNQAGNVFNATSQGNICVFAPVVAPTVSLTTAANNGNLIISDAAGTTSGTTSVNLNGTGSIVPIGPNALIQGLVVSLKSLFGNLGTPGSPVNIAACILDADTNSGLSGTIGLVNLSSGQPHLQIHHLTSGGATSITDNNGSLTVSGPIQVGNGGLIARTTNNLELIENVGSLTVNKNISVFGGSVLIQNNDVAAGSIAFGVNTSVTTLTVLSSPSTNGNVTVAVGSVPATPTNQNNFNTGIIVMQQSNGKAYAGDNPTAILNAASSINPVVFAKGRDVIFNTPSLTNTISLGSNVLIKADPPTPVAAGLTFGNAPIGNAHATHNASMSLATAADAAHPGQWQAAVVSGPVNARSYDSYAVLNNNLAGHAASATQSFNTLGSVQELAPARSCDENDSIMIFDERSNGGRTVIYPSVGSAHTKGKLLPVSLASSSAGAAANRYAVSLEGRGTVLERGGMLFLPNKELCIETKVGKVNIGARSVVLVVADVEGVAVYNLHDEHAGNVNVTLQDGSQTAVGIGRHVLFAQTSGGYDHVNPLGSIAHRNMQQHDLKSGLRQFSSEFSIVSALSGVKTLSHIAHSTKAADIKLTNQLMKNAAILISIGGNRAPFQKLESKRAVLALKD